MKRQRPAQRAGGSRPAVWHLLLVLAVAAAVRVIFMMGFYRSYFWMGIWSDAATYNQWARLMVQTGDWLGKDPFFMTPLYPYFLGIIYAVMGENLLAVRVLQAALGVLTSGGIMLLAERLVSPRAGLIAGLLAAVYGPFVLSNNLLLVETLKVFLLVASTLVLLVASTKKGLWWWLFAGVLLGLTMLARPTDALAVVAALLWIALILPLARQEKLYRAGAVVLGSLLVVAPVTIRNYAVSGEFIVITSNGGLNFYLGNNEQAVGVYYNVDGLDLANDPDGRVYAQTVLGTDLRPSEVSGFYMSRAWDFIRDEPGTFLELLGLKALLFMHGKEISQLGYNYQFVAATAVPLLAWLPTFLIVGPLGLAGVYLSLVRWRSMFLVTAMLAAEFLGVVLFFVTDRFRLSAMPFLMVFAGAAVVLAADAWRSGRKARLGVAALVALGAILASTAFNKPLVEEYSAEYEYVGLMHFHAQQYDNALRSYRSALRYRNSWHLQNNIGSVFLARGEAERAMAHFNIGHTMNPRQAVSTFNMGNVFVQKRNMSAALGAFSQAIAVNPRFAPAYLNKGLAHWHLQEYDSALVYMERYVEMERDPSKTATVRKDIEYLRNATRSAPSSGAEGTGRHP